MSVPVKYEVKKLINLTPFINVDIWKEVIGREEAYDYTINQSGALPYFKEFIETKNQILSDWLYYLDPQKEDNKEVICKFISLISTCGIVNYEDFYFEVQYKVYGDESHPLILGIDDGEFILGSMLFASYCDFADTNKIINNWNFEIKPSDSALEQELNLVDLYSLTFTCMVDGELTTDECDIIENIGICKEYISCCGFFEDYYEELSYGTEVTFSVISSATVGKPHTFSWDEELQEWKPIKVYVDGQEVEVNTGNDVNEITFKTRIPEKGTHSDTRAIYIKLDLVPYEQH